MRDLTPGADAVHDQTSNLKKIKNVVGIYKFKKYRYAKMSTLIFVLNPHLHFRKKKN